jgi:hypothetical protein
MSGISEHPEIMQQGQSDKDEQYYCATLDQKFEDVVEEKPYDDENACDQDQGQGDPTDLVEGECGKIERHASLPLNSGYQNDFRSEAFLQTARLYVSLIE